MQTLSARTGCPAFQAGAHAQQRRQARRLAAVQASSDPLLQKPVARPSRPAEQAAAPAEPEAAGPAAAAPAAAAPAAAAPVGVTMEYQRQQAKAMRQYFLRLKESETVERSKFFGWTRQNEINNGRWVMMGIAIGLLTELATGVSLPEQIKLMASYMGLIDLD